MAGYGTGRNVKSLVFFTLITLLAVGEAAYALKSISEQLFYWKVLAVSVLCGLSIGIGLGRTSRGGLILFAMAAVQLLGLFLGWSAAADISTKLLLAVSLSCAGLFLLTGGVLAGDWVRNALERGTHHLILTG